MAPANLPVPEHTPFSPLESSFLLWEGADTSISTPTTVLKSLAWVLLTREGKGEGMCLSQPALQDGPLPLLHGHPAWKPSYPVALSLGG